MRNTLILAVLFVAVLAGGLYLFGMKAVAPAASGAAFDPASPLSPASSTAPSTYTSAQVAQHDTAQSCWSSINGSVYDLTSWISQHPGGEGPILSICGKDGTSAFEGQHAGDPRANAQLATFKIGALAS